MKKTLAFLLFLSLTACDNRREYLERLVAGKNVSISGIILHKLPSSDNGTPWGKNNRIHFAFTIENESSILFKEDMGDLDPSLCPIPHSIKDEMIPSLNYKYYIGLYKVDTAGLHLIGNKLLFEPQTWVDEYQKKVRKNLPTKIPLSDNFNNIELNLVWDKEL